MRKTLIAALFAALAAPALATPKLMIDHPSWDLYQTETGAGCFVLQEYQSGGVVIVGYNRREGYSSLLVTKPSWRLTPNTNLEVLLKFGDETPVAISAHVQKGDTLMIDIDGRQLLDKLQSSKGIELAWGGGVRAQIEFVDMGDGISALKDLCVP